MIYSADTAGSDHCFRTCCPCVRPSISTIQNLAKQNIFQARTLCTPADIVGLAEWIIDDTWLVRFSSNIFDAKIWQKFCHMRAFICRQQNYLHFCIFRALKNHFHIPEKYFWIKNILLSIPQSRICHFVIASPPKKRNLKNVNTSGMKFQKVIIFTVFNFSFPLWHQCEIQRVWC